MREQLVKRFEAGHRLPSRLLDMGSPSPSLVCAVCLDLIPNHLATSGWRFNVTENLLIESSLNFSFSDIEVSSQICALCSVIKDGVEIMFRGDLEGLGDKKCSMIVHHGSPVEVEVFGRDGNDEESVRMQFFAQQEKCNLKFPAFGTARDIAPLVSSKSHSSLIQSWITGCLETHGACGQRSGGVLPTRLLHIPLPQDSAIFLVYTRNLPVSSDVPSYATLSHCWGKTHFIKTVSSNVDSFQKGIPFEGLPSTFQDAISVARELGIQYIWIDSLCIIQDSIEDWKHESALMASVYSNSYLNIAATGSSDSSKRFLASRDLTHQSRHIPNKFPVNRTGVEEPKLFVRASLNRLHKLYSTHSRTLPWSPDGDGNLQAPLLSRAWVFQERYLAPRTLHFHQSELVMECRAGLRCECSGLDHFTSNPLRDVNDISFTSWFRVVEEFSRLNLSYQSDRLEALMGVAKMFWERLGCSYLHGIWEDAMVKGLLWNVTRPINYRTTPSKGARQENNVAPTWSWASLVIPEGSRIYFPADEGETFRPDERFEFLGTDPPINLRQSLFRNDSDAILVKGAVLEATAYFIAGEEDKNPDPVLIFHEDLDDAVLITILNWNIDILPNVEEQFGETPWDVACLLLGSAEESDEETNELVTVYHMLVLRVSSDISGAWERVGILNIEEEVGSPWVFEEKIFKLV